MQRLADVRQQLQDFTNLLLFVQQKTVFDTRWQQGFNGGLQCLFFTSS